MFKTELKWLWDYLAEQCLPLRCLLYDDLESLEIWVNAEISSFDLSEVCATLDEGIAKGRLSLYTSDEEFEGAGSIAEILKQRNVHHRLEVGYTAVGGAEWETQFQADWDKFYTVQGGYSFDDPENYETVSLNSPNEQILSVLMSGVEGLGYEAVPGTLLNAKAGPWRATYWKSLPECYRLQFLGKAIESMANWPELPPWHT